MNILANKLVAGAQELGVALSSQEQAALMAYLELLQKWNKAYNLTAIRDPEAMVSLHLLDSLALVPFVREGGSIIDVGTGPGLPGIILAIMYPEKPFTLLDSNGKKTRFLFQVKTALSLDNVTIVNERVEAYHPEQAFDMITSRAFASLADMVHWCQHLRTDRGCFLAMKGQYPEAEIAELEGRFVVTQAHKLCVPGVDGERHVLQLNPA